AATPSPPGFVTYRVFATQYDPNTPGSDEAAVPDRCAKFAALHWSLSSCPAGYQYGMDWRVFVVSSTTGQGAYIPIKDTGPWNIDDNYWDPSSPGYPRPRRLFGDLPRGKPESQAAFYDGYNTVSNCKDLSNNPTGHPGGADQFGRCVLNPSALDLSPAAATTIGLG